MKKFLIILMLIILILSLITCSVSETTGLIQVRNRTHLDLTNVYLGDKLIAGYVASGGTVDYWFFQEISGKLRSEGIEVSEGFKDIKYTLKPGYWVWIDAKYDNAGNETVVLSAEDMDPGNLTVDEYVEN